ncbi:MAG: lipopolysaccharide biosynthesis protein [Acutalibacteraceae bacterium]
MRTKNSMINILVSCFSYGIIMIGSFATRQIFANTLGLEIVGIEGGFLNVVSVLAIVELGLGVGIVYKLYKPIADKDWEQVEIILCFLRKCYFIIAFSIIGIGLICAYFVVAPIKEDFSKLWLIQIFMLYVIDVVVSYLYSHKRAMFIADQKNYINNTVHIFVQVLLFVCQIGILKVFGSFELYLLCKIIFRATENLIISYKFDKCYDFINLKTKKEMLEIEKKDLFKNMKALLCHKISGFGATTASSLIIMYFISLRENGIYCNYMLIVMGLNTITGEVFNGVLASFGNLLNTSSRKKVYDNFKILYFINFLIYSFVVSAFLCLSMPFISLWTGEGSAFSLPITVSIAAYLYVYGIRQSIVMAKNVAGIYDPDKYMAVLGAVVTFAVSLILAKPLGIIGVMIGNVAGIMTVPYWVQSYLVYDEMFRVSVKSYHSKFCLYTILTATYSIICYAACGVVKTNTGIINFVSGSIESFGLKSFTSFHIAEIIVYFAMCVIIPNTINFILFFKTTEFKGLMRAVKSLLKKVKK